MSALEPLVIKKNFYNEKANPYKDYQTPYLSPN